jgi:hypothetical protein
MPGADRAPIVSCSAADTVHHFLDIRHYIHRFSYSGLCLDAHMESITIIHIQQYPVWRSNSPTLLGFPLLLQVGLAVDTIVLIIGRQLDIDKH